MRYILCIDKLNNRWIIFDVQLDKYRHYRHSEVWLSTEILGDHMMDWYVKNWINYKFNDSNGLIGFI